MTKFAIGDRLRNTLAPQQPVAIVTELTLGGFRYTLVETHYLGPRIGWTDSGESHTDDYWEKLPSPYYADRPKPGGKITPTFLERQAVAVLNTVKAWRDSDGNEGFPHEARERIDALLMTFEQQRAL